MRDILQRSNFARHLKVEDVKVTEESEELSKAKQK